MRVLFFAGKGGVGKTSVAASTGVKSADMGYRTLIMSLDTAHNLVDIFDLKRNLLDQNRGLPIEVKPNLWIQELDIEEEIQNNWGDIHRYLSILLKTTGLNEILAEEFAILPGMAEISLLLYINRYYQDKQFDVLILDCAPTGESIRFISIPTTLEWYIKKIFKLERKIVKYVRPVASRVYDVPLPDDDYFQAIEHLFERLRGVDQILIDPQITSMRLVANPEKIVIKETQRAFMYFSLYKMNIDGIIMNRILPDKINDAYFKGWSKSQRQCIQRAEEYFSPIPIFPAPLFKGEIYGYRRLKDLAKQIYGDRSPLERFFEGQSFVLNKEADGYHLKIRLPFAAKNDLQINKLSNELIVRLGSIKKHVLLPRPVAALETVKAKLEGHYLTVKFEGADHEQGKA